MPRQLADWEKALIFLAVANGMCADEEAQAAALGDLVGWDALRVTEALREAERRGMIER